MQFLYAFGLIFLLIFGFTMLIHVLARALLDGGTRCFDVYVKRDENISDFLKYAENAPFIGRVYIIEREENGEDEQREAADSLDGRG